MCRLLESIYLKDGVFRNLDYHQARINKSTSALFDIKPKWSIQNTMREHDYPKVGLFKMRVVYDRKPLNVEFVPYQAKKINSLKLIESTIDYSHKYERRDELISLINQRDNCDDIVIAKNGFVTDSSYSNLIFRKGNYWFTPTTCLLKGTMREYLLNTGLIKPMEISIDDLDKYESCKLINAMLGIDSPEIPITAIK